MTKGKSQKDAAKLTDEQLKELMNIATITYRGKGPVSRDKVAKFARQRVREQRNEYQAMRKRIRAARYLGKYATAEDLTADDVEMVSSFISGKATAISSEEFAEFAVNE